MQITALTTWKGAKIMSNNFKKWLKYAGIRAIKTFAQTAVAMVGTAVLIEDAQWLTVLSAATMAAALSLLTSAAGLPEMREEN